MNNIDKIRLDWKVKATQLLDYCGKQVEEIGKAEINAELVAAGQELQRFAMNFVARDSGEPSKIVVTIQGVHALCQTMDYFRDERGWLKESLHLNRIIDKIRSGQRRVVRGAINLNVSSVGEMDDQFELLRKQLPAQAERIGNG